MPSVPLLTRAEKTPGQRRAEANLVPFRTGNDPNRRPGSPSFSRKILSHLNVLADTDAEGLAKFSLTALSRIANDECSDHARAVAAGILCYVREVGWDKIARSPKMLQTLSWLFDRQLGKPRVQVEITHKVEQRAPHEIAASIIEILPECLTNEQWRGLLSEGVRRRPELAAVFQEAADQAPVDEPVAALPASNDVAIDNIRRVGGSRP